MLNISVWKKSKYLQQLPSKKKAQTNKLKLVKSKIINYWKADKAC